mmetsp:Transcript_13278/g.48337  ORF Transcript_13278/g.48337 Transcript_13278/m.48337 type:complete len:295 (-) Transcript_13278:156-1040(-)
MLSAETDAASDGTALAAIKSARKQKTALTDAKSPSARRRESYDASKDKRQMHVDSTGRPSHGPNMETPDFYYGKKKTGESPSRSPERINRLEEDREDAVSFSGGGDARYSRDKRPIGVNVGSPFKQEAIDETQLSAAIAENEYRRFLADKEAARRESKRFDGRVRAINIDKLDGNLDDLTNAHDAPHEETPKVHYAKVRTTKDHPKPTLSHAGKSSKVVTDKSNSVEPDKRFQEWIDNLGKDGSAKPIRTIPVHDKAFREAPAGDTDTVTETMSRPTGDPHETDDLFGWMAEER